jgi:hypothetical protein
VKYHDRPEHTQQPLAFQSAGQFFEWFRWTQSHRRVIYTSHPGNGGNTVSIGHDLFAWVRHFILVEPDITPSDDPIEIFAINANADSTLSVTVSGYTCYPNYEFFQLVQPAAVRRVAVLKAISSSTRLLRSWTLPRGILVLFYTGQTFTLTVHLVPANCQRFGLPAPIFEYHSRTPWIMSHSSFFASFCHATNNLVVAAVSRKDTMRSSVPFSGQLLSLIFDSELKAVVECKEMDLAARFAPLLPKLDCKAQKTEFGGLALSEDGMSGVMVFARGKDDTYRPDKPRQFVVVFEPRQGVVLRTILVRKDFAGQLDFLYPFRFDQNSILFGVLGKTTARLSLTLVKCDIGEDGLRFEDEQRQYLIDTMPHMADPKGRLQEGMHSIACLVDNDRLLVVISGSPGRPKRVQIGVPGDGAVESLANCWHFQGMEIANVFERSIREFGLSTIWIANCDFIQQEYLRLSVRFKPQSNNSRDQLLSTLRSRIGQQVLWQDFDHGRNYMSYGTKSIPWTLLFIKFCSVPEVVVMAPIAPDDAFARRQCTAFVPALLAALPTGKCFSVSYVGTNGTGIISSLTGMEFTCRRNGTMSVGSTILPVAKAAPGLFDKQGKFTPGNVANLVNVVGSLFTVSGATAQAIGFIAAVLMSDVVIVEVEELNGFWEEVKFSCDFVLWKFGLSFSRAKVDVFVIGGKELEIVGIPETSSVHDLCGVCKFQFVSRGEVDKIIGGSMKIGSNLQVTSGFVGDLRKSCGLFGSFVDIGSSMISVQDVFDHSEKYRRTGDVSKSEWLCRQSAQKGSIEARYSLCDCYKIEESERSSFLEGLALSGHVESAWKIFTEDKSRIDCIDICVSHGHVEAKIEKARSIGGSGAIDILFEVAKSGNEDANELLYEYRNDFNGEVADWQSRYWVSRDAWKSYLCYNIAKKKQVDQDFKHYRLILNSLSHQYSEPSDLSAEGLRRSLNCGNKLAAVHLAELLDDGDAKKAILKEGLPTRPAFFALGMMYFGDIDPPYDVIYECYRDGILAEESVTTESTEMQEMLMGFFRGETGPVSDWPGIRLELARFLTDPAPNSFSKEPSQILASEILDDDLPEFDLLWLKHKYEEVMASRSPQLSELCQRVEKSIVKASGSPFQGELEYLSIKFDSSISKHRLKLAADHGCADAQLELGRTLLNETQVDEASAAVEYLRSCPLPGGQFLYSLIIASGSYGVTKDLPRAREIWRTISAIQRDDVPESLRPARIAFAFAKWQQAQDDDELACAMYDIVAQSMRDVDCVDSWEHDSHLIYILLQQIYLNPRVQGIRRFPKHVSVLVRELNKRQEAEIAMRVIHAFFDDPQLRTVDGQTQRRMEDLRANSHRNYYGHGAT